MNQGVGGVVLRRKTSLRIGSAERDTALEMVDEVLEAHDELGLPNRPKFLTGDKGYGSTELITALLDAITPGPRPRVGSDGRRRTPACSVSSRTDLSHTSGEYFVVLLMTSSSQAMESPAIPRRFRRARSLQAEVPPGEGAVIACLLAAS